jgi:hypothetical protein
MRGFCNVWVCVCVGFVICGCVYVWEFWQYVYLYLLCFVLFVLFRLCIFIVVCFVYISVGLLPPSEKQNSIIIIIIIITIIIIK